MRVLDTARRFSYPTARRRPLPPCRLCVLCVYLLFSRRSLGRDDRRRSETQRSPEAQRAAEKEQRRNRQCPMARLGQPYDLWNNRPYSKGLFQKLRDFCALCGLATRSHPMTHPTEFIERLAELDRAGHPFVVVTLVDAVGSTPQDVGSKMLVNADGLVFGTVGGGRVEQQAIETAQQMLTQPQTSPSVVLVEWNLQRDVGMTCGGTVKLFFEGFNLHRWRIVIFGAGHVAQALTRCLLNLDCQIVCIDSRPEWLSRTARIATVDRVAGRRFAAGR